VAVDTAGNSRGRATSGKRSGLARSDARKSDTSTKFPPAQRPGTNSSNPKSLTHSAVQELIGASFQALDLLNIGLIVCNASGRMLFTNQTSERILLSQDGLEIDATGVVRATNSSGPALPDVIAQIASSAEGAETTRDVAIALARRSGRRALTLLLRSIETAEPRTGDPNQAAVLIIVTDADVPVPTREIELRRLYGLTSTESRLAKLLMEGKDLDDCCGEMGITRATVRMHRRNLFSKTGVRRQTQLITLLFKSIGLGPRPKE
jgi:DNA-binding CsgD family transcriptional regulator